MTALQTFYDLRKRTFVLLTFIGLRLLIFLTAASRSRRSSSASASPPSWARRPWEPRAFSTGLRWLGESKFQIKQIIHTCRCCGSWSDRSFIFLFKNSSYSISTSPKKVKKIISYYSSPVAGGGVQGEFDKCKLVFEGFLKD